MNKIQKLFKAIGLIFEKPYLLNLILESDDVMKDKVTRKHGMPEGLPVVDIDELFGGFKGTANPYAYLSGATMPIDIALLRALALRHKVENYFEIGTWRGESVANMAQVVGQCTTLNLSMEEITALTHNEKYAELHGFFSKKLENVKQIYGNSNSYDFTSHYGQYDMVFVDGDHHYESVKKDTENAFRLLRNENSIIVWHDYAIDPETVRWDVMAAILDGSPADRRNHIFHVSNTLCAVYLPDTPSVKKLVPHERPEKYFKIDIQSVKC